MVDDYFTTAIADREDEIARRKMLFQLADDNLIKLTAEEKEINDNAISFLEGINNRQQDEKEKITTLMLQNPTAWQNARGSIDITQSFDEIAKQLLPFIAAEETARRVSSSSTVPSGIRTNFATEEEEAMYNISYDLVQAEQAGSITPEQWSGFINNIVAETGLTYEQAENQVIANMQEIQGALQLTGRPNYGASSGSDLGGDVDADTIQGFGASIRESFDPFAFPKKAIQFGKGIGEFGAGLFGFDVLGNKKK